MCALVDLVGVLVVKRMVVLVLFCCVYVRRVTSFCVFGCCCKFAEFSHAYNTGWVVTSVCMVSLRSVNIAVIVSIL